MLLFTPVLVTLNLIFKPKELPKFSEPEGDTQVRALLYYCTKDLNDHVLCVSLGILAWKEF